MSTVLNNNGVERTITVNGSTVKLNSIFTNISEPNATANASLKEKGVVKKIDSNNTIGSVFYESSSTSDNSESSNKALMNDKGVIVKKANKGATLTQAYWANESVNFNPSISPYVPVAQVNITQEIAAQDLELRHLIDIGGEGTHHFYGSVVFEGNKEGSPASCNINFSRSNPGYIRVYNYGEELDFLNPQGDLVESFAWVYKGSYDIYINPTPIGILITDIVDTSYFMTSADDPGEMYYTSYDGDTGEEISGGGYYESSTTLSAIGRDSAGNFYIELENSSDFFTLYPDDYYYDSWSYTEDDVWGAPMTHTITFGSSLLKYPDAIPDDYVGIIYAEGGWASIDPVPGVAY